jgi:lysophospholipase L1-like esterase
VFSLFHYTIIGAAPPPLAFLRRSAMRRLAALALLACLACVTAHVPGAAQEKKPDPLAPVADDPALPRVLLIGDSISIGYTLPTRQQLKGTANLHRIPENGGPTTNGVAKLDKWLGDGKWDAIHFNFGLHDIKLDAEGKPQVSPEEYEKNLRAIVKRLKATNAKLIWATTTPVPDAKVNPPRKDADVVAYNAIARKVMEENGVAVDDLYGFAKPQLDRLQQPANVHFTDRGSDALAEKVAGSVRAALKK